MTGPPTCAACGAGLRAGLRFCTSCGASLAAGCPACGAAAEPGERFCGQCGTELAPAPAPVAPRAADRGATERKQVSVLFADVARSMDLAERLEAEEWSTVVQRLIAICRAAVERYGGTVDKFTGDGVMALFGAPVAQEDHARRACHAALAVLEGAAAYAEELRPSGVDLGVRVGLNSGEVVAGAVGGTGYTAVGHTVGLAQRMEALAAPGSACLTGSTARLAGGGFVLRDLGAVRVKGSTAPVRAYALDGLSGGPRRVLGSARFVGRAAELAALEALLTAAQEGHAQVVGVVAEAGAGKSRLCEELALRATALGLTVRRTAGVSHAQDAPLLPIRGLLRDYFGIAEAEPPGSAREKVAGRLLGLDPAFADDLPLVFDFMEMPDPDRPAPATGPDARRRRVLEVLRRATLRRSERDTLVLVLEDLHWFDPHSVAFLDGLLPSFPGTRTLVVTNFRPEFRPPWARHSYYRQLPLAPLDSRAVDELLAELIGQDPDPELDLLGRQVRARAGGNPFFLEEIVRALAGEGTLEGEVGAYRLVRSAGEVRVPPTVQGVLAARIDQLPVRDKAVLQAAAVIGRTFAAAVLGPVADLPTRELAAVLDALCRAELLQLTGTPGEYRFWHPLTQEVAYGTLLAAERRRLHRAVAEAVLAWAPGREGELAAVLATHYEAAGDAGAAARWQVRAGAQVMRTDFFEARRRMHRALEHLEDLPDTPENLAVVVRARTFLLRFGARLGMDVARVEEMYAAALPAARRLADPVALAGLALARGTAYVLSGEIGSSLEAYEESCRQADAAGETDLRASAYAGTAFARCYGGPVAAGLARIDAARDLCGGDPRVGVPTLGFGVHDLHPLFRAMLLMSGGELAEARVLAALAAAGYAERPVSEWKAWALTLPAILADRTGETHELAAAARCAEEALQLARDSGNATAAVRAMHAVGVAELVAGRTATAAEEFREAVLYARKQPAGLMEVAPLLGDLARAYLAEGASAAAREAAGEAVAVARRQRGALVECGAQLALARVLRSTAAGDGDLAAARAAIDAGDALVARSGGRAYAPFLAEERARLAGGGLAGGGLARGDLAGVAAGYDAIGATGHARRIRAEIGPRT